MIKELDKYLKWASNGVFSKNIFSLQQQYNRLFITQTSWDCQKLLFLSVVLIMKSYSYGIMEKWVQLEENEV